MEYAAKWIALLSKVLQMNTNHTFDVVLENEYWEKGWKDAGNSSALCFFSLLGVHVVTNYNFDKSKQCVGTMMVEIDFLQKKNVDSSQYDSDKMAAEFIQHFNSQAFSAGQQVREL